MGNRAFSVRATASQRHIRVTKILEEDVALSGASVTEEAG
jgi:hypothetical protein